MSPESSLLVSPSPAPPQSHAGPRHSAPGSATTPTPHGGSQACPLFPKHKERDIFTGGLCLECLLLYYLTRSPTQHAPRQQASTQNLHHTGPVLHGSSRRGDGLGLISSGIGRVRAPSGNRGRLPTGWALRRLSISPSRVPDAGPSTGHVTTQPGAPS